MIILDIQEDNYGFRMEEEEEGESTGSGKAGEGKLLQKQLRVIRA